MFKCLNQATDPDPDLWFFLTVGARCVFSFLFISRVSSIFSGRSDPQPGFSRVRYIEKGIHIPFSIVRSEPWISPPGSAALVQRKVLKWGFANFARNRLPFRNADCFNSFSLFPWPHKTDSDGNVDKKVENALNKPFTRALDGSVEYKIVEQSP